MGYTEDQYRAELMYGRENDALAEDRVRDKESAAAAYRAAHPHLSPPVCQTCNGSGWVTVIPPQSCHHMRGCIECIEADEGVCPDCQGTGRRKCIECGEFDATEWADNGDGVCSICGEDRRKIA